MSATSQKNAQALKIEFAWFKRVLDTRMQLHFGEKTRYSSVEKVPVPDLFHYPSTYSDIVRHFGLREWERLIILLALAPHISPKILDVFFTPNPKYNRAHTQFGGLTGKTHSGFLPTIETALFLLVDDDFAKRFLVMELFEENKPLQKENILQLRKHRSDEPKMNTALNISEEFLNYFTSGKHYKPDYSSNFPAQRIHTQMDWEDLVLDDYVMSELLEIPDWLRHKDTILHTWGMGKRIKSGYRALFYGPPGTGKTLTASLIGKSLNLDVYRIDISQVVSKYIGETEKNMANIFDQAQNKNWILFFDEADALFGKRTATSDAKDRHANQEIAYLLQRVETFSGVVILATNLKSNIDQAFARRFQTMIHFRMPNSQQRHRLWQTAFAKETPLSEDINLYEIAQKYELTGGAIINVSRYCALSALRRGDFKIWLKDILHGIRREYAKEGRTM